MPDRVIHEAFSGLPLGGSMDTASAIKALGQRLAELRNERGMSQSAVDRHFDWPPNTTFRLERGNSQKFPSPETLRQLAGLYGVTVYELMVAAGYTDEEPALADMTSEEREAAMR